MFQAIVGLASLICQIYLKNTSYQQQLLDLERKYHEELSKPDDQRSDAVLCNIERELCELAAAITSAANGQKV